MPVSPHSFAHIVLSRLHLPDGVHLGLVMVMVEAAIVLFHIGCKDNHYFSNIAPQKQEFQNLYQLLNIIMILILFGVRKTDLLLGRKYIDSWENVLDLEMFIVDLRIHVVDLRNDIVDFVWRISDVK